MRDNFRRQAGWGNPIVGQMPARHVILTAVPRRIRWGTGEPSRGRATQEKGMGGAWVPAKGEAMITGLGVSERGGLWSGVGEPTYYFEAPQLVGLGASSEVVTLVCLTRLSRPLVG
ncbi:hypothetical protein NL676_016326 [Syzygium grande]|nr:hypothetical protein NL676_016326 [Syzygium grande]